MKPIRELNLGFGDAENYRRRENKDLFNTIFVKNDFLDKLLDSSSYFLIGEKGTGKTAYSVFLNNNEYKETVSHLKYLRETDYQKFVTLKTEKHLQLSDYASRQVRQVGRRSEESVVGLGRLLRGSRQSILRRGPLGKQVKIRNGRRRNPFGDNGLFGPIL